MPVKGGTKCIKYLLFGFNFIFWVSERDRRALLFGATCSSRGPYLRSGLPVTGTARARGLRAGGDEAPRPPAGSSTGSGDERGGHDRRGLLRSRAGSGTRGSLGSWGVESGPGPLFRRGFGVGIVSAPPAPRPSECRRGRRQGETEHPTSENLSPWPRRTVAGSTVRDLGGVSQVAGAARRGECRRSEDFSGVRRAQASAVDTFTLEREREGGLGPRP